MLHLTVLNASSCIADEIRQTVPAFERQLNEDVISVWPVCKSEPRWES